MQGTNSIAHSIVSSNSASDISAHLEPPPSQVKEPRKPGGTAPETSGDQATAPAPSGDAAAEPEPTAVPSSKTTQPKAKTKGKTKTTAKAPKAKTTKPEVVSTNPRVASTLTLCYGCTAQSFVLIPLDPALEFALVNRVMQSSSTWGELRKRLPVKYYSNLTEAIVKQGASLLSGRGNQSRSRKPNRQKESDKKAPSMLIPDDGDPFDFLTFYRDMGDEWGGPPWLEQAMLDWLPASFIKKFREKSHCLSDGECLLLDPAKELEMLKALEKLGHRCIHAPWLVNLAAGEALADAIKAS